MEMRHLGLTRLRFLIGKGPLSLPSHDRSFHSRKEHRLMLFLKEDILFPITHQATNQIFISLAQVPSLRLQKKQQMSWGNRGGPYELFHLFAGNCLKSRRRSTRKVFSQVRLLLGLALRLRSHLDEARIFSIACIYLLILVSKQF